MTIQQMFVAFTCFFLATQQIAAVVNNPKSANSEETTANKNSTASTSAKGTEPVASGTETEAKRREAPAIAIGDTYGVPLSAIGIDSYVPTGPSNPTLPIPVYGVPDGPSNHIVYPGPPPDIPPPLPQISTNYGPPLKTYGLPQTVHLGTHFNNFVPPPPPAKYGPPIKSHKPFHGKPSRPRPQYGPPQKPVFVPKLPKPNYGPPPKQVYGPPKSPLFVPQKNNFKQQSVTILTVPSSDYGVPNFGGLGGHGLVGHGVSSLGGHGLVGHGVSSLGGHGVSNLGGHVVSVVASHGASSNLGGHGISVEAFGPPPSPVGHYGPPNPIPHGPPHPGVPAPPTPPDIKYDGWHPIPGLVSRPPSDSYGVPESGNHGTADLHDNSDFSPPPVGDSHGHSISVGYSSSSVGGSHGHSASVGYSPPQSGVSDSYGAPLNSVTGSGAVVTSSGDSHHDDQSLSIGLSAAGIKGQSQLSVIKSIGYELFPNTGSLSHIGDSYSSPPLSSYSSDGPYAAAHSHKTNGFVGSIKSHHSSHGHSLSSSSIGLIPPSGVYGAPPSSQYGTPLLSKPSHHYGAPLNALKINPPQHPVIFREPVPVGLIESVGKHTAHKDAHGIVESSHSSSFSSGPTYIPPPIPDITKPVREEEPPAPSHLYSLPNPVSPISFQTFAHGTSGSGVGAFEGHSDILTSYTAPLGSIDGSYSLPLHSGPGYSIGLDHVQSGGITIGVDNALPPVSIDLTSATSNLGTSIAQLPQAYNYQQLHDCSSHKSQLVPSLSYGVPSASSYTAALSSLTTNIGGSHSVPSGSYGPPDLETEHSQKVKTTVAANTVEGSSQGKSYGKSLAQKFGPETELIRSESIDINNFPVKGSLGSYTLQIQPADGLGGTKQSERISHAHVLNGGLLQSILAAIEQPQRKDTKILGRPLSHLQPSYDEEDSEGQHSVTNAVVLPAPATEVSTTTPEPGAETEAPLRLIDNNEIALYFSNGGSSNNTQNSVRNGQQYGSYVSFKTPNSSFVYGNSPSDKSQEAGEKD